MPKGEEASGVPWWAGVGNSKPFFEFMVSATFQLR